MGKTQSDGTRQMKCGLGGCVWLITDLYHSEELEKTDMEEQKIRQYTVG